MPFSMSLTVKLSPNRPPRYASASRAGLEFARATKRTVYFVEAPRSL